MATIVLVHGGFTDGSYWSDVATRLTELGHHVEVIDQLPSVSYEDPSSLGGLEDDAEAIRAVVDAAEGPVVLVTHSGGGMAVTELADHPNVARSVYIAATFPERGQSALDVLGGAGGPTDWIVPGDDGAFRTTDDLDRLRAVLCGDVDEARARESLARRPMQSVASAMTPSNAPERKHPVTYVVTEEDVAIPPAAQWRMAQRADDVVSIRSAHQPMTSAPHDLAALLDQATRRSRQL
jgi:pimeloyl-ACP methyl ester carboxylesterase